MGSQTHLSKIRDESTITHNTLNIPSPDVTGDVVPDLQSVADLSAVKETVLEIVPKIVTEIVSEVPKIVPDVAKIVPKVQILFPRLQRLFPRSQKQL